MRCNEHQCGEATAARSRGAALHHHAGQATGDPADVAV